MAKTVNVDVTRTKIVPKYRKARRYSRRFLAHDENQECSLGDVVRIAPCRPLSRRKPVDRRASSNARVARNLLEGQTSRLDRGFFANTVV